MDNEKLIWVAAGAGVLLFLMNNSDTPVMAAISQQGSGSGSGGTPAQPALTAQQLMVQNQQAAIQEAIEYQRLHPQTVVAGFVPSQEAQQTITFGAPGETPIDGSGIPVGGVFPPNAYSSVVYAAGDGPASIASGVLLTLNTWNKLRASYNAQHGGCCPNIVTTAVPGVISASQYKTLLSQQSVAGLGDFSVWSFR